MLTKFLVILTVNIISVYTANTGWYKNSVFYHVYVRSFKDSDNDGIGDLKGVIEKMDYLSDLGVTVVWLSPIFKSPQIDHGYDISDHYSIDPIYGDMSDLIELLRKAEQFGIKILLDLIPNHTSDQHYWFKKSVNCEPGYEDYYVWADPKFDANGNRKPPTNWIAIFSNSTWTWNEKRQQYYLHYFYPSQPDLNLRNKDVVEELQKISTFYLDLGAAGFRIDAVSYLIENKDLLDDPFRSDIEHPDPKNRLHYNPIYTQDTNESYEFIYEIRSFIDKYNQNFDGDEKIILTEVYTAFNKTKLYCENHDGTKLGAHFTFNFDFTYLRFNSTANDVKNIIDTWTSGLDKKYMNWVLSNHDNHRVPTRMGNVDGYNMLVTFLPGISITYYAEEIGQENGEVNCEEGTDLKVTSCATFDLIARDFERTPFQWDATVNAGFNSGAKPWLPIRRKFRTTNLACQNVPGLRSHYNIYKDMIKLRKHISEYDEVFVEAKSANKNVLHIVRKKLKGRDTYVFLFNMERSRKRTLRIGDTFFKLLVSSTNSQYTNGQIFRNSSITLLPQESLVLKEIIPEYPCSKTFASNFSHCK
ncbi:maltase 1-like [Anoplophora glabripennis]|uniref:maltase 1-like n=1 Tax=Anoplophora glabripennis TaxID=217634 RepID=UPI000875A115|nr:maltase 1-like [Anoplophora glabripennis]